jgi:hypothetical protein
MLLAGLSRQVPMRRTLAGHLLELRPDGALAIRREGPRRRGRAETVTPIASENPPSLGREPGRA